MKGERKRGWKGGGWWEGGRRGRVGEGGRKRGWKSERVEGKGEKRGWNGCWKGGRVRS